MRRLFAIATVVLVLGACGSAASPSSMPLPALTGDPRLLLTSGGQDAQQLVLWDIRRGTALQTLPMGVVSPDRRLLYTVVASSHPQLQAVDIASGKTVATLAIPEGFNLPQGLLGSYQPMGLSANGAWLALQSFDRASQDVVTRTRYLVTDTNFRTAPKTLSLNGEWDFDALSNDGQGLYLLQDVNQSSGASSYRVRLYDLAANALWPQVIVDKRLWGDAMSGTRLVAVPSADQSWLYSLYAFGSNGPFVHALSLDANARLAWCVDLPSVAGDGELDLLWTLVRSGDGQHLYAVNAGEGLAVEIALFGDSPPPVITRKARFTVQQTSATSFLGLVVNAEAKRFLTGGAVLSADGRTVYALGNSGIYAVDTATLKVRQQYLLDVPFDTIAQSADGRTLFAFSSDQHKLFRVDPGSGRSEILSGPLGVNSLVAVESR